MPRLNQFNGGMNLASAPHLVRENEGVIYDNVDHIPGSLRAVRDKVQDIAGASKFGYEFEGTWYWSSTPQNWVEFQERLYRGNRLGISAKLIAGVEYNLGIAAPTVQPAVAATTFSLAELTSINLTAIGTLFTTPAGDIPDTTDLEYRFVNKNAAGDLSAAETTFNVSTGSLGPNAVFIKIEDKKWTDDVAVYRKYLTIWRLVATVSFDPLLAYDKQPGIIDSVYDISGNAAINEGLLSDVGVLNGVLQYAVTFYNSVDGSESVPLLVTGQYNVDNGVIALSGLEVSLDPQVTNRRIYRIGGDITAYHLVSTIDNVVTTFTDSVADLDLVGTLLTAQTNYPAPSNMFWLTEAYAMFFAAVGDKLRFTPIGEPNNWPLTYFLDFPETITGIAKTPVGLLVFTHFYTYLVTGTGPLALAQVLLSGSQGCVNGDTVVNVQGAAYWASTDGICVSQGGQVIVYTRQRISKLDLTASIGAVVYDQQYYIQNADRTTFVVDPERNVIKTNHYDVESLVVANDTLYGFLDGFLHRLEDNFNRLSMNWISPAQIGAGLTVAKVYRNIFVHCRGDIRIEVYIDEVLVANKSFDDFDNHQVQIPSNKTRGFQITFAIFGTGTVHEIRWDDTPANA